MTTTGDYLFIYICTLVSMLVCRVFPIFAIRGHVFSERIKEAFSLIPVASFAALIANDLIQPNTFSADPQAAIMPLIAAVPVIWVAKKTKSLIWSAIVGMVVYALLIYIIA